MDLGRAIMPKKPTTLKPAKRNKALEVDYSRKLKEFTKEVINSFNYWTKATINKSIDKNLATQLSFNFNTLMEEWDKKAKDFAKVQARGITKKTTQFVNAGLKSQGIDLGIRKNAQALENTLSATYRRNYNLIKSIPQDIKERFENALLNNVNSFDAESIYKQVQTIKGISLKRANVIAKDQVNKAIDGYNSAKEESLGFEYYVWQTSKDEAVSTGKGGHSKLEGRLYRYDTPTAVIDSYGNVGHPSDRVNCRCRRRAVLLKDGQKIKKVSDSAGDYYVII